jgi:beta-lactamase class A
MPIKSIIILFAILVLLSFAPSGPEAKPFRPGEKPPEFGAAQQQRLIEKIAQALRDQENKVGYVFLDAASGRCVSFNGATQFPAASVAKLAVMNAAFNLSQQGKLDLEQKVVFRDRDKLGGSGVLQWMRGGQEYTLWNLIRLMIVLSDNTATRLVVENVGVENINNYLLVNGMPKTRITDATMLTEPPAPQVNLTTPNEIARALLDIRDRRGFSEQGANEMLAFMKNQRYRWGIWRGVPRGVEVADKTGNLEGVLNDAGIVYSPYGDYILSIFTWGFKDSREARLLINDLARITYEEYTGEKITVPVRKSVRKAKSEKLKPILALQ